MSRILKIIALFAAGLIAIGLVLGLIGYSLGGSEYFHNDFDWNSPVSDMVQEQKTLPAFHSIKLEADVFDLKFVQSMDNNFSMDYRYRKNKKAPTIEVAGDTLKITTEKPHYRWWQKTRKQGEITVSIPKGTSLHQVQLDLSVGEIYFSGLDANTLQLYSAMGSVEIQDSRFEETTCILSMGDLDLKNVQLGKGELQLSMGSIDGTNIESNALEVNADMGDLDLEGNLLGKTDLVLSMGSVKLKLQAERSTYQIEASLSVGSCEIDGENDKSFGDKDRPNQIEADLSLGDMRVSFF